MAHKIAMVEIEFYHTTDQDGDAILREHLEEMVRLMQRKSYVGDVHYHLPSVRNVAIGDPQKRPSFAARRAR